VAISPLRHVLFPGPTLESLQAGSSRQILSRKQRIERERQRPLIAHLSDSQSTRRSLYPYRQRTPSRLSCVDTSRGQSVKLYSYFRSSAAYRVRIALNLKGIPYEMVPIHLTKDGGRQHTAAFRAVNPQARVPALELSSGEVLTQSLAIIEYLDDIHPEPPLLPADALDRAKSRAIAQIIACDIHPLNNLVALQYLKRQLKHEQPEIDAWYHHWIIEGFTALEGLLAAGPYACGAHVTLADICLVPQVANARRLKVPLNNFPKIVAVDAACQKLPAFERAKPENQPDAE
jgi:maleylacetoacetate isomerase